jgi:tetrahydromethanopterin S-methyltransferase subunit G
MSVAEGGLPAAGIQLDRAQSEARPPSETLGRRAVAQDQTTDRSGVVGRLERLGARGEPPIANIDVRRRIGEQVGRPLGVIAGRDEDRTVGLFDEADRDRPRSACPTTAGRDPGDLPLEDQVVADVVRARLAQRDRCQDLPSVWVDGA